MVSIYSYVRSLIFYDLSGGVRSHPALDFHDLSEGVDFHPSTAPILTLLDVRWWPSLGVCQSGKPLSQSVNSNKCNVVVIAQFDVDLGEALRCFGLG